MSILKAKRHVGCDSSESLRAYISLEDTVQLGLHQAFFPFTQTPNQNQLPLFQADFVERRILKGSGAITGCVSISVAMMSFISRNESGIIASKLLISVQISFASSCHSQSSS